MTCLPLSLSPQTRTSQAMMNTDFLGPLRTVRFTLKLARSVQSLTLVSSNVNFSVAALQFRRDLNTPRCTNIVE